MKNTRIALTASAVVVLAGGSAAAIANAQTPYNPYGPYNPTTTTTPPTTTPAPPKLPSASSTATTGGRKVASALQKVKRISGRTKITVAITKATPGKYTITVFRKGTKSKLLSGYKTLKGTTQKTLKVNVRSTKSGRSYLKRVKRSGKKTVSATQQLTFKPTTGKSVTRKRTIKLKL